MVFSIYVVVAAASGVPIDTDLDIRLLWNNPNFLPLKERYSRHWNSFYGRTKSAYHSSRILASAVLSFSYVFAIFLSFICVRYELDRRKTAATL